MAPGHDARSDLEGMLARAHKRSLELTIHISQFYLSFEISTHPPSLRGLSPASWSLAKIVYIVYQYIVYQPVKLQTSL